MGRTILSLTTFRHDPRDGTPSRPGPELPRSMTAPWRWTRPPNGGLRLNLNTLSPNLPRTPCP
eukprot:5468270-Lingulodinium_polyedra.AAC.1